LRSVAALGLLLLIGSLASAAQAAAANGTMKVIVEGAGAGEIKSIGEAGEAEIWPGEPPIACAYAAPGPATGVCEDEMTNEEGSYGVFMTAVPAPGSEFSGWVVEGAEAEVGGCETTASCLPLNFEEDTEITVKATFNLAPANGTMKVIVEGAGAGEIKSIGEAGEAEIWPGEPPIACAYAAPGPATGVCEDEMTNEEGSYGVFMTAVPAPGSEFSGWVVEGAEAEVGGCGTTASCLPLNFEEDTEITVKATFNLLAPPAITGVSPNEGSTAGGQQVTITGENLDKVTQVQFGETAVVCTGVATTCIVESATEIKATAPSHAAGVVDVTATGVAGTSPIGSADHYTYVAPPAVTAVSPAQGPSAGGNLVEIIGLRLAGATKVEFGTTVVNAPFAENTATKIRTPAPAHALGTVNIRVTTIGGISGNFPQDDYAYVEPAVVPVPPVVPGAPPPPPPPPLEEKCVVPKLANKSLGKAKSALKSAHCVLGKVTKPKQSKGPLVVRSSSPGVGKTPYADGKVDLKLGLKKN
jgi:hypothetical protein